MCVIDPNLPHNTGPATETSLRSAIAKEALEQAQQMQGMLDFLPVSFLTPSDVLRLSCSAKLDENTDGTGAVSCLLLTDYSLDDLLSSYSIEDFLVQPAGMFDLEQILSM